MDVDVEARIHELLAARRPILEQLVRHAVDAEITALVDAELERTLPNGNGATRAVEPATKLCTGPCGRTLPVSAFEKGRAKCRQCRRAENREREQRHTLAATVPADQEPPRPEAQSPRPVKLVE